MNEENNKEKFESLEALKELRDYFVKNISSLQDVLRLPRVKLSHVVIIGVLSGWIFTALFDSNDKQKKESRLQDQTSQNSATPEQQACMEKAYKILQNTSGQIPFPNVEQHPHWDNLEASYEFGEKTIKGMKLECCGWLTYYHLQDEDIGKAAEAVKAEAAAEAAKAEAARATKAKAEAEAAKAEAARATKAKAEAEAKAAKAAKAEAEKKKAEDSFRKYLLHKLSSISGLEYLEYLPPKKIESFNVPPSEIVNGKIKKIIIPLSPKERIVSDEQFANYSYQAIQIMKTHPKYGERMEVLLNLYGGGGDKSRENRLIVDILSFLKNETATIETPIGTGTIHRWEPRFGVYSVSYAHVLMEMNGDGRGQGPGLRALENLGRKGSIEMACHPVHSVMLLLGFLFEKTSELEKCFPLLKGTNVLNAARLYNGDTSNAGPYAERLVTHNRSLQEKMKETLLTKKKQL